MKKKGGWHIIGTAILAGIFWYLSGMPTEVNPVFGAAFSGAVAIFIEKLIEYFWSKE